MPEFASLEQSYRRYALYEKGQRRTTVTQTLRMVRLVCEFARTSEIRSLDTPLIREFLQVERERKGWSAKTFRLYRQYLKTFFDWTVSQRWIKTNPVSEIQSPRLPNPLPRCLSKDDALKLLSHVHWHPWRYELEGSRNKAIIATFLFTGIRMSELLDLRTIDIDLENGELQILSGKNEKGRSLAIHPQLLPILREYRASRLRLGVPSQWFFPSVKSEKRLTVKNLHEVFRKLSVSTGTKVTPHMLRHTFGRLSVESNINLRIIQGMMGHSSIRTTQNYTFVSTKAMKRALAETSLI